LLAIILVAGSGNRIKEEINNKPICMIRLNNKSILSYILYNLINNNIKSVIIAVGYRKNIIVKNFESYFYGLKINYATNNHYHKTGNMYSLSIVYNQYNKLLRNKDVIILESDIIFSPSSIKTVIKTEMLFFQ